VEGSRRPGELSEWHGLGEETLEPLTSALAPVEAVAGPAYAERRLGRFDKYTITRSAEPVDVRVWVPVDDPVAALIEYDDPVVTDVDALLDSLGEPEEVQHNQRFRTGSLVDEQVYAGRGLDLVRHHAPCRRGNGSGASPREFSSDHGQPERGRSRSCSMRPDRVIVRSWQLWRLLVHLFRAVGSGTCARMAIWEPRRSIL